MTELWQTAYHQTLDYLQAGGPVMPPLAGVSLVMWLLIMNRALFFRRLHRRNMPFRTAREYVQAKSSARPPWSIAGPSPCW